MNLIAQLEAEQIATLSKDIPDFKAGDTVRVGFKVQRAHVLVSRTMKVYVLRAKVKHYRCIIYSSKDIIW